MRQIPTEYTIERFLRGGIPTAQQSNMIRIILLNTCKDEKSSSIPVEKMMNVP